MSASNFLVIDPPVLVSQVALFLVNIAIVKKFIVTPYLDMRDKRSNKTVGGQEESARLKLKSEEFESKIQKKIDTTITSAHENRLNAIVIANEKKDTIIDKAKAESKKVVEQGVLSLKDDLKAAQKEVPIIVKNLVEEIYSKALN